MKNIHHSLLCISLFFTIILPKETTLFEEVRNRDKEAIRKRLDNDEDCSQQEEETGHNALHIAADNDDEEMIELLTTQPDRSGFRNWFYYCIYNYPTLPDKDGQDKEGDTPAHRAMRRGHGKATQKLLQKNANPNKKNKKGKTLVHEAVEGKQIELIGYLAQNRADLNLKDNKGLSPLNYSIIQGHLPSTLCLVDHGVDVNMKNDEGDTPFHLAISENRIDEADYLIQKGADVTVSNRKNFSPIFWAVEQDKPQFISLFVKYGLHGQKREGWTLLHYAIYHNKHASIPGLAQLKDLVNQENPQGKTAVLLAAEKSDPEILKVLHANGADLNARASNGLRPIHSAAFYGNYETTKYLLDNGVQIDVTTNLENTPLLLSIQNGALQVSQLLLERKANANIRNTYGEDAFLSAINNNRPEIVTYLKQHCHIDINSRDKEGRTGILNAATAKNHNLIHALLKLGANLFVLDNERENILHKMARNGDLQGLEIIFHTADAKKLLSQQNIKGNTPLLVATAYNNQPIVIKLLDLGANCNIKNKNDETPLFFAVYNGNSDLVSLLAERYDALVNIVTKDGRIPIFVAIEKGYTHTTKSLLKAGASLLSTNKEGLTILHVAAMQSNTVILQDLLMQKERPNIDALDNSRSTPLQIAAKMNNIVAMQLLEQWSANPNYTNVDGNNIAHYAASGKAVDALDYIIKKYPYLINFQNKNKETPLMIAAKVNSLECVEKLLCENDFISRNIDKSANHARLHGHITIARTLEQKINNRMTERLKIAQKGQEILNTKKIILELDEEILQKDFSHRRDYMLEQSLSPRLYSSEELYNKTNEECETISWAYTKMFDAAMHKKHHLINKRNEILRKEEAAAIQKECEERRIREENDRLQRLAEENRRKEIEKQQIAIKAQQDELDRLAQQKEREEAHKKSVAVVAAQKEAERLAAAKKADAEKHAAALDQQQAYVPMDLKPSAPPMEKTQEKCMSCQGDLSVKPLPCKKCKKKTIELCNTCIKKQNGQCATCWNEVGKFTHKEQGECNICFEETQVTPPPCKGCKKGTSRYCTACLKELTKCPTCMAEGTIDKKLMDEIVKQK